MQQKPTAYIIAHTHWDREWYLTHEQFRVRLVHLVDNVIELLERDDRFRCFHLDGQTIVLDDYLDIRPENRSRLAALIRDGRILIGPWYQQNDLFLTSGESTVRNLQEGIWTARERGGEMKVGYLPDHFGLIGQMPQIFRAVGIDAVVFGRGFSPQAHNTIHFVWQAPDGSTVNAANMPYWYNNAQRLPHDKERLIPLFKTLVERETRVNPTGRLLLMNGVDHLEAQENLPDVIQTLVDHYGSEYEIRQSTLVEYVQDLWRHIEPGSRPIVEGELRENGDYSILSGTLSARWYIKAANARSSDLIEKFLEPLACWNALLGLAPVDHGAMRHLWKLLMQNHPHDSICGCSQDSVHEHMMDRFRRVDEIAGEHLDDGIQVFLNQIDTSAFETGDIDVVVVNPSQIEIGSAGNCVTHRASLYLLDDPSDQSGRSDHRESAGDASTDGAGTDDISTAGEHNGREGGARESSPGISLLDADGRVVPLVVDSITPCRKMVLSPINLPGVIRLRRFDVRFQPRVPAGGYSSYRLVEQPNATALADTRTQMATQPITQRGLENAYLRVTVAHDGRLQIVDKAHGRLYERLLVFEDEGDAGDLYVCKPVAPRLEWYDSVVFTQFTQSALGQALDFRFDWSVPEALDLRHDGRSATTVAVRCAVQLRLDAGSRHVGIDVEIENVAKDHRLRLVFATPQADCVWAGGQFDVVERAVDNGRQWARASNTQPFWKLVAAPHAGVGLALFARGLFEYEMIGQNATAALALTVVRGVETINTRETVPLLDDYQPLGQCLGRVRASIAIRPFADTTKTQLMREAEAFAAGLHSAQRAVNDPRWFRGRTWVQGTDAMDAFVRPDPNSDRPRLARHGRPIAVDGEVLVSAIAWAHDGNGAVIRLYNVEEGATTAVLTAAAPIASAYMTNLLEEITAPLAVARERCVEVSVAAKRIVTIRLVFAQETAR